MLLSSNTIYFVYNAKNGLFNTLNDFTAKTFTPNKYPCNLCKISYGLFTKKKEWKEYLTSLQYPYEFIYINDNKLDLSKYNLPIILYGKNDKYNILVNNKSLNECKTINELIKLLNTNLLNIK